MNEAIDIRSLPTRITNVLNSCKINTMEQLQQAVGPGGILCKRQPRNFGEASYRYLCRWLSIPAVEPPIGKIPRCEQKTARGICRREAAVWIPEFRRRVCSVHAKCLRAKYPHLGSTVYALSRQKRLERLKLWKQERIGNGNHLQLKPNKYANLLVQIASGITMEALVKQFGVKPRTIRLRARWLEQQITRRKKLKQRPAGISLKQWLCEKREAFGLPAL